MSQAAASHRVSTRSWAMTDEAWQRLVDEIAQLRADLASLAGQGLEEGIVRLPLAQASRRLETLRQVLDAAELATDPACAAIGRRVTLRDNADEAMTYWIVFPGDGDPEQGWISADSPLGAAVLGARAGDVVDVVAPVGRWPVTILAVD